MTPALCSQAPVMYFGEARKKMNLKKELGKAESIPLASPKCYRLFFNSKDPKFLSFIH